MSALIVLLLLAGPPQEDQTPRPPQRNRQGLLAVNRDFYEMAAATGGDFYFWAPQEFATSNLAVPIQGQEVLLSYGSIDGKRVFEIPVEGGVRSLTIFCGVQRRDLAVVIRPDGVAARERDPGAVIQSFQHMTIATIESPAAGTWSLELTGAGLFAVTAHVRPSAGGIELISAEPATCEVSLSGEPRDVRLTFVSKDGTPIRGVVRQAGTCIVPDVPFRTMASGFDASGNAFQRVERPLRTPASQK
jgi:hypothetical protein